MGFGRFFFFAVILSVGWALTACATEKTVGAGLQRLLSDATVPGGLAEDKDPTVMRSRAVDVRYDVLASAGDGGKETTFAINLFDDAVYVATVEKRSLGGAGGTVFEGRLENTAGARFTLVVKDKVLVGNISFLDGTNYQIRYTPQGVHVARQIDATKFPPEGRPLIPNGK
jgi:hypothetical protein